MEHNQFNDIEFIQFYFNLKDNFRSAIQHSLSSKHIQTNSEILSFKIDFYFESIFGGRHNSSLYDYYNSLYFEIKDVEERNNKIILKTASDFIYSFSSFFDIISESRFVYFLKSTHIEKKLGFQNGDKKFSAFLITNILKNIRFKNQDFNLVDVSYGTILNAFAEESIKNIRQEIFDKKLVGTEEILKDINTLELRRIEGNFEFLEKPINLLRLLKSDIDSINNQDRNINSFNKQTEVIQFFDNRKLKIKAIDNRRNDKYYNYSNKNVSHYADNSTRTENNISYDKIQPEPEKQVEIKKITIKFSPSKFRDLLVKFFQNAGIQIDPDKENRIVRFILNVVDFDKNKYSRFKGSSSTETINFFNEEASILKFCALLKFLEKCEKTNKLSNLKLYKILSEELQSVNDNDLGISTNLRNKMRNDINKLHKEELAKYAGFKNCIEINSIIINLYTVL